MGLNIGVYGIYRGIKAMYIGRITGKQKNTFKVINKETESKYYKIKKILKYLSYFMLWIPGLLGGRVVVLSIPICLGIGMSIISILRESKLENAYEYQNGIKYRGKFYKWSKVEDTGIYGRYLKMRIGNSDLERVRDNSNTDSELTIAST